MPDAFKVERIAVVPGRLSCDLRIADPAKRTTTPELAQAALAAFPSLAHHACVNDTGPTFGLVAAHTSVPHLVEHIAIDIQTHASADEAAEFVGTTEWLDEEAGLARIELSFKDDAEALRALNKAIAFVRESGAFGIVCKP